MTLECPRCHASESAGRPISGDESLKYHGIRVMDRAMERGDDLMICLHCGCQFYRRGAQLHPHGVEIGREDVLLGEDG